MLPFLLSLKCQITTGQTSACLSIGVYERPTLQTITVVHTPTMAMDKS